VLRVERGVPRDEGGEVRGEGAGTTASAGSTNGAEGADAVGEFKSATCKVQRLAYSGLLMTDC